MRVEENTINYIRNAIDLTVGNTGYPCLGRYLEESGVATRQQLRTLEKKGILKAMIVQHNNSKNGSRGTQYKAYYTERNVPELVAKQEELETSEA